MDDLLGITDGYHDVAGTWHDTPPATRELFRSMMGEPVPAEPLWFVDEGATDHLQSRCRLWLEDGGEPWEIDALPAGMPIGYHRLEPLDGGPTTHLVVAPRRCPEPPYGWGVAAQIYSLWRRDSWGIGDLRDVEELGARVGALGGMALLLSPLHAPAPTMPQEPSPYFPSSRRWLNPLLIPMTGDRPGEVHNEPAGLIDRDRVWAAKRSALAAAFQAGEYPEWRGWARAQGADLWRFCTFNALADRFGPAWQSWPHELRHPDSTTVQDLPLDDTAFASDCEFHAWLQYRAHRALDDCATGAGVRLIGDLAVGCAGDGADAWLHQDLMALGASVGAPPDPFNAAGQDWGLPPFVPWRLRAAHYEPFVQMVRAACRRMGGLRIDHVMGLFRQFWVPHGGTPADGAYVRLPAHELLAIIRIEATRAGAFVVGEDLGTVEAGVREQLRDSGVLGTKVWLFDPACDRWEAPNLATVTTHDLPTVAGVQLGLDGTDAMREALTALAPGANPTIASVAVHHAVAESPAVLVLATTDDLAGMVQRPNHPGTTTDQFPNWSRRLPASTGTLLEHDPGASIVAALQQARAR